MSFLAENHMFVVSRKSSRLLWSPPARWCARPQGGAAVCPQQHWCPHQRGSRVSLAVHCRSPTRMCCDAPLSIVRASVQHRGSRHTAERTAVQQLCRSDAAVHTLSVRSCHARSLHGKRIGAHAARMRGSRSGCCERRRRRAAVSSAALCLATSPAVRPQTAADPGHVVQRWSGHPYTRVPCIHCNQVRAALHRRRRAACTASAAQQPLSVADDSAGALSLASHTRQPIAAGEDTPTACERSGQTRSGERQSPWMAAPVVCTQSRPPLLEGGDGEHAASCKAGKVCTGSVFDDRTLKRGAARGTGAGVVDLRLCFGSALGAR